MKVSVIIAVYNGEKYIEKSVKSLCNQTLDGIEIIIINDGSNDNTEDILLHLKKIYKNIIVINQPNLGVSEARNAGLKIAKGKYIGFMDSDDLCEPNMFEEMYNKAVNYNVDVVISGIIVDFYEDGKLKVINSDNEIYANDNETLKKLIAKIESKNMFNFVWNKLYKYEVIENFRFNKKLNTGEDLLFNCKIFKNIESAYLINKSYYHYRRGNEETIVTKYKDNLHENIHKFNDARVDLYKTKKMNDIKYIYILNNKCIEYYISDIINLFRNGNRLNHKQRFNKFKQIFLSENIREFIEGYEKNNINKKMFFYCYKFNNVLLSYIIYYITMNLRYKFSKVYNKLFR